jgi:acyl-CoA reductase-like NAD-dependent aldehyde dehydrogenase
LVPGGAKDEFGDLYYKPTILTNLTPDMNVTKEEIFGPVSAVYKFKTEEVRHLVKMCDCPITISVLIRSGANVI